MKKVLSSTNVAGIRLSNPLMNAAYLHSKTMEDVTELIKSPSGAIVVGSITLNARNTNKHGGYWRHKNGLYSLNSFGMPNDGYKYFKKNLPEMTRLAHSNNKPVIVNIAGFKIGEYTKLLKLSEESKADMVELNLGCPNAWDSNKQKQIISYHPKLVKDVLDEIKKYPLSTKVSVKISPLPPDLLHEVADIITKSKIVGAVTATNSYPNAYFTTGTGKPTDILTGMSGSALKPISIGVVKQLRALLPSNIEIIGCGGINSLNDVIDYLEAGANAVQLATSLMDEGLGVFNKLLSSTR